MRVPGEARLCSRPERRLRLLLHQPRHPTTRTTACRACRCWLPPHPDLDRGLTQRVGQISDLRFKAAPAGSRDPTSRRQRGLTGLKKVCLPPADGLLADHLSPGGLRDRHLADDHAQHDPGLLLSRDPGGGLPRYLTLLQDRLNCPATKSDARQRHPSCTVPRDDYDPKNVTRDSTHPVRGASVCCPLPGVG